MDATAANLPRTLGREPSYEAWYVTLNDGAGRGYWFRYTTQRAGLRSQAGLWAAVFDHARPQSNRAAKETYPLTALELRRPFALALAGAELTPWSCRGKVAGIAWHLEWESLEKKACSVVQPRWQWLASVGNIGAQPWLRISGSVTVDGEERRLEGAYGGQQHTWGRSHALTWNWGYAAGEWGWFDGVSARARSRLGRTLAWTGVGAQVEGRRFLFNTPWRSLRRQADISGEAWRADLGALRFVVVPRPEDLISVQYDDPPGGERLCQHAELARLELELEGRQVQAPAAFEYALTP